MANAFKSVLVGGSGTFDLDSLVITTPASKSIFKKGDPIDLTGLVVTGTIGHMSGDVTQDCTVTPSVFEQVGQATVTLSYGGLSVSYQVTVTNELRLVSWSTGTDSEIAAMLGAYYNDELNIFECDGWNIGAERTVQLSAMPATYVNESQPAQTVTMVLMDANSKTLVTPINGHTKGAFVVGQKGVLTNSGYMDTDSSGMTVAGWNAFKRRAWCNNIYKNAFAESFRVLFKEHINPTSSGYVNNYALYDSHDYFALPSSYEITGRTSLYTCSIVEGTQFEYYKTAAKQSKGQEWWTRSCADAQGSAYVCYRLNGEWSGVSGAYMNTNKYISPFGVI